MFGSHLSIAGGLHNAALAAETLGMDTVQVFTKNQQQWKCKPLEDAAIADWRAHCDRLNFAHTVSHDSYLINLASPDDRLWRMSIDLFIEELKRCILLHIPYLVTHPGAHMDCGEEAGLKRVAEALDIVHEQVPLTRRRGQNGVAAAVVTCLEITAGQGTCLGHRLEHLATIIEHCKAPQRLAVCLDTAHLFAAGYDFRGRKYAAFMREVDHTVGLDRVKVFHLNDSKKELGSRVDRHEHIGRGQIGLDGFKPLVRDKRWRHTPKILETAKGKSDDGREWDAVNLETLKSLK
ncbi:MAG TPA: deoxyribonuclease IV [Tepidisphaeraceae bacterium]|jgi:deoxyribonuclease-4